jgi:cytochrome c oxidase subunit I+III
VVSGVLLLFSSAAIGAASRALGDRTVYRLIALIAAASFALASSLTIEILGHWGTGLRANASGYGAMTYLNCFLQLQVALPLIVMAGFVLARRLAARLDGVRRVAFDNLGLLWHYAVGQGLLGLLLVHGFPRLIG